MLLMASLGLDARAGEVATEGATPGAWTMDLEAAQKLAKEKDLPLLLNFTGSDWCGWCKLMDKSVFAEEAWKTYAAQKLVLVTLDFPRDKSIVPEKFVARNRELSEKFGVQGYPTYVVLDADGTTELGRLGAGRDKTPRSFQDEVNGLLRFRAPEVEAFAAKLEPAQAEAYKQLVSSLRETRKQLSQEKEDSAKRIKDLEGKIESIGEQVSAVHLEARVKELGPEKGARLKELTAGLAAAEAELEAWTKTGPEQNEENSAKFKAFQEKIAALRKQLAEL
jgi:thiol-disulfide isomerase/thioredoxin